MTAGPTRRSIGAVKTSRAKPAFVQPWPVTFTSPSAARARRATLQAYLDSRRRVEAYLASPKSARVQARFREAVVAATGLSEDLLQAEADLAHLRAFEDLAARVDARAEDLGPLLADFVHVHTGFGYYLDLVGCPLGDIEEAVLDAHADRTASCLAACRAALARLSASPTLTHFAVQPDVVVTFVDDAVTALSDRDLLLLAVPPADEIYELAIADGDLAARLDVWKASAQRRAGALRPLRAQAATDFRHMNERIALTQAFLLEPVERALRNDGNDLDTLSFVALMEEIGRLKMRVLGVPRERQDLAPRVPLQPAVYAGLALEEEFWYVVLFQIFARHGGVEGDRLRPWCLPLLANLLNHPSRLMRLPVDREGEKARTALARRVAPYLRGPDHPATRTLFTPDVVARAPAPQALRMAAEELTFGFRDREDVENLLNAEQRRVVEEAWQELIEPFVGDVLDFLARCDRADGSPLLLVDLHMPPPDVVEAVERHIAEEPAEPAVALPPIRKVHRWVMVADPAHEARQGSPLAWDSDQAFDADAFFREHRIALGIPPESVLNALDYYETMQPVVRALLPHEPIGGHLWRKLKRGKARILVREHAGQLIFHAYQRKDWKSRGKLR